MVRCPSWSSWAFSVEVAKFPCHPKFRHRCGGFFGDFALVVVAKFKIEGHFATWLPADRLAVPTPALAANTSERPWTLRQPPLRGLSLSALGKSQTQQYFLAVSTLEEHEALRR